MVKELDLKALTTATETLQNVAGGGGAIDGIARLMQTADSLLKSGMALYNTMTGNKGAGGFQPLSQLGQPAQPQQPGQPANPINPQPATPPAQKLDSETIFKSIEGALGLLTKLKPNMTVTELVKELQVNKVSVMNEIQKGIGGANVKP